MFIHVYSSKPIANITQYSIELYSDITHIHERHGCVLEMITLLSLSFDYLPAGIGNSVISSEFHETCC